jgi:DNA-binding response OmpR family regulator
VVLLVAPRGHALATLLERERYAVVQVPTGAVALEWVRDVRPDAIVLDAELPDMSGLDACQLLHGDLRIDHFVPILILAAAQPTPEQRVAALKAGAWDFLRYPSDIAELSLQLATYVQAKRNMDIALAEGAVDPASGLYAPPVLARRARELGALMARAHGALACVVFELTERPADHTAASLVARCARVSDVVGALGPARFAVLAPATDHAGAVRLARRVGAALRGALGAQGTGAPGDGFRAGYHAVANFTYTPLDPVELLRRAVAAVHEGAPEPDEPWVRRYEPGLTSAPDGVRTMPADAEGRQSYSWSDS